jgi:copper resistance protein B
VALLLAAPAVYGQAASAGSNGGDVVQGHAGHGSAQEKQKPPEKPKPATAPQDHSAHQKPAAAKEYPPGIPPITDEDRAAAFPALHGQHAVHDRAVHSFVLFDRVEWQAGDGPTEVTWDNKGWVGGDVDRFWFRTEGGGNDGRLADAQAHALYGRAIHPWWDLVAGVRQDVRPGPARTWAAIGIQGLAPYWFEVEATAYVGESGRTHLRLETEYELLVTNRLILQPRAELDVHGRDDVERGIGAGVSSLDTGLRLRYEFRREIAPYVGITWNRKFSRTADLAEAAGEHTAGVRLALGVRVWF